MKWKPRIKEKHDYHWRRKFLWKPHWCNDGLKRWLEWRWCLMQPLESDAGPAGYRIMSERADRPVNTIYPVRD